MVSARPEPPNNMHPPLMLLTHKCEVQHRGDKHVDDPPNPPMNYEPSGGYFVANAVDVWGVMQVG